MIMNPAWPAIKAAKMLHKTLYPKTQEVKKMKFIGSTSFVPGWEFPVITGESYTVATTSYGGEIDAIITNQQGQRVRCPYSNLNSFMANWSVE